MFGSSKKVRQPDDPDPTPIASADSTPEVQGAARSERKRIAGNYGRTKTILAGNTAVDQSNKKTILGS
jgi:hypothetical protein